MHLAVWSKGKSDCCKRMDSESWQALNAVDAEMRETAF